MKSGTIKHEQTFEAVSFKLNALLELIETNRIDEWAGRASFDQFCNWEDTGLGIKRCAKSNFSPKHGHNEQNAKYAALKENVVAALDRLNQHKCLLAKKKSKNTEIDELKAKISELEAKNKKYLNDYTIAREHALSNELELQRTQQQLSRLKAKAPSAILNSVNSRNNAKDIIASLEAFLAKVEREEIDIPISNGSPNKREIAQICGFAERNWTSDTLGNSLNSILDKWLQRNINVLQTTIDVAQKNQDVQKLLYKADALEVENIQLKAKYDSLLKETQSVLAKSILLHTGIMPL